MNGSGKAKKKRGGIFGKPSVREQFLESKAEAFFARETSFSKPWTRRGKIKRYLELLPPSERKKVQQEIERKILEAQKRIPDKKMIEKVRKLENSIRQFESKEEFYKKKEIESKIKMERLENQAKQAEMGVQETYKNLQKVEKQLTKKGKGSAETQTLIKEKMDLSKELKINSELLKEMSIAFNAEQEKTQNLEKTLSRIEKEKENLVGNAREFEQIQQSSGRVNLENKELIEKIKKLEDEKLNKGIEKMIDPVEERGMTDAEKIRLGTQITEKERKRQEKLLRQLKEENAILVEEEKEVKQPVFEEINPLKTIDDIGREVDRIFKLNNEGEMSNEEWDKRNRELGELTRKITNPTKAEAQELRDNLRMADVEKAVFERGFLRLNADEARLLGKVIEKESEMSSQNAAFIESSLTDLLKKANNMDIKGKELNNLKKIQDKLIVGNVKGLNFENLYKSMKKLEANVKKTEEKRKKDMPSGLLE